MVPEYIAASLWFPILPVGRGAGCACESHDLRWMRWDDIDGMQ